MIEFSNVTKKYPNGCIALDKANVTIQKGEFVFLIGQSGSGKTTFFKLIMKEEELTEGRLTVNGLDTSAIKRRDIPYFRRNLGIVFQDFRLLHDRSVYENVAFSMRITESQPKQIRRQVPMALGLVGISRKAHSFPSELSGGEQQRVALARAIVNNPSILIADEPTGNLDPENSWEIMRLLLDINQRGTTVIVATHEKNIVDALNKRVIAIENGIITRDQLEGFYTDENQNDKIHD